MKKYVLGSTKNINAGCQSAIEILIRHDVITICEKPEQEIYKDAIEVFGAGHQMDKFIEEIGEVLQAYVKYKYNRDEANLKNVRSELADLQITLNQAKIIFDEEKVEEEKILKLERLVVTIEKQRDNRQSSF